MVPLLWRMRKEKFRETDCFAQGHTARQNQGFWYWAFDSKASAHWSSHCFCLEWGCAFNDNIKTPLFFFFLRFCSKICLFKVLAALHMYLSSLSRDRIAAVPTPHPTTALQWKLRVAAQNHWTTREVPWTPRCSKLFSPTFPCPSYCILSLDHYNLPPIFLCCHQQYNCTETNPIISLHCSPTFCPFSSASLSKPSVSSPLTKKLWRCGVESKAAYSEFLWNLMLCFKTEYGFLIQLYISTSFPPLRNNHFPLKFFEYKWCPGELPRVYPMVLCTPILTSQVLKSRTLAETLRPLSNWPCLPQPRFCHHPSSLTGEPNWLSI